jgi:flagellar basal-body rod modification protein FlgD
MALPLVPIIAAVAPKVIGAVAGAVTKTPDRLGKEEFLKLLIAQLKNQNPLNPIANDQFISQSAMFSSLEELQNIRKGVESMAGGNAAAMAGAASLVGRHVTASSGRFTFDGRPVSLPFTLTAPAAGAVLEVTDGNGTVVTRQPLGARSAGQQTAVFTPPAGQVVPSGDYRYRIVSMDGARSIALPVVAGSVTGITLAGSEPVLQVGPVSISLSDITSIGSPTH